MTMIGLNTESMRAVARQLRQQGDRVSDISRSVDSLLQATQQHWCGDDVNQFRQSWERHRVVCLSLAEHLTDLARIAEENIAAQVETSRTLAGPATEIQPVPGGNAFTSVAGRPGDALSFNLSPLYDSFVGGFDLWHTSQALGGLPWNADLEDVDTDSALWKSLLYLPDSVEAFKDAAAGELTSINATEFTGTTFDLGSTFLERFGTSYAGEAMGRTFGAFGGALHAASDWGDAQEAFQNDEPWAGVYHAVHGGVAAVGGVVKPVGLGLTAWDFGVGIGTAIGTSPPAEAYQDSVVAFGATQGDDIGTRYNGLTGFGNFVHDSAAAAVEGAARSVSSATNFIGSLFR